MKDNYKEEEGYCFASEPMMPDYLGEMSVEECEAICEKDSECTAYEMSP